MPAMDLLVSGCRTSDVTLQFSPKWRCNFLHFYLQLLVFLLCNKYRQADGIYRLDHAVTATQKTILKAFGIDANYVKRKAREISDQLNPKVLTVRI